MFCHNEKRILIRDCYLIADTMSSRADAEIVRDFARELELQVQQDSSRHKSIPPRP